MAGPRFFFRLGRPNSGLFSIGIVGMLVPTTEPCHQSQRSRSFNCSKKRAFSEPNSVP